MATASPNLFCIRALYCGLTCGLPQRAGTEFSVRNGRIVGIVFRGDRASASEVSRTLRSPLAICQPDVVPHFGILPATIDKIARRVKTYLPSWNILHNLLLPCHGRNIPPVRIPVLLRQHQRHEVNPGPRLFPLQFTIRAAKISPCPLRRARGRRTAFRGFPVPRGKIQTRRRPQRRQRWPHRRAHGWGCFACSGRARSRRRGACPA